MFSELFSYNSLLTQKDFFEKLIRIHVFVVGFSNVFFLFSFEKWFIITVNKTQLIHTINNNMFEWEERKGGERNEG